MLILSRKVGEAIHIGDDIVVTVVDIRGDKVRFGTVAPRDVPVHRTEVYAALKRSGAKHIEPGLRSKTTAQPIVCPTVVGISSHELTLRFASTSDLVDALSRGRTSFAQGD